MRPLLLASALVGLVFLAACSKTNSNGAAISKSFMPLVPPDTKVLAGVQLDRLKATALYQRHQNDLNIPLLQESTDRIGMDPRRDISEVLIAWDGKSALSLVHGTFDPSVVSQKLIALNAQQTTYKNHQIFGDARNSIVFVSKGFAIAGDGRVVDRALDSLGSVTNGIPEQLEDRLKQVSSADQVWIVSNGLPFADAPMRSDIQSALSNITNYISGATLTLMVDTGTHFKIDLTCVSEEGAKRVHDALRGAIGLGRLSTKDDQQELMQVYDAISVDQDKTLIHVHADYSGTLTDQLFQQLGQVTKTVRK